MSALVLSVPLGALPLTVPTALPRLTAGAVFGRWRFDPFALGFVVLAGALYAAGIRRVRRAGGRWSAGRTAAFYGLGLGAVVIATCSVLAVYARVLLWPVTTANIMLDLLAPLGLAIGDPIGLVREGSGPPGRARLAAVLASPLLRFWTFPLVSSAAVLASELSIYFTPYLEAALTHPAVWQLMHLQLLVTGLLFVLPMLSGVELLPAWCTPGVRVPLVFVDGLFDSLPGIFIMVSSSLLAGGWYARQPRDWGPSVRLDQQIAGGVLFSLAELVALPFLVAVFVEWWRHERARTAELDARLDAEEAARAAAAAAQGQQATADGDGRTRPWWETDPAGRD
ncbi:putative copper resistance protein D [Friedmanniella endophytica]|uniref:Putative copper resistance protein D n=1 Tax=Microlunatus kandeliicorticis TaxID=1759536 RepID=A0A7W3P487_9ACTN|nr:cytochrome c oxidase assembly protein [Microlunatus kandeliicorticis]MBA8792659.1 putative copper resistance protein D [Microlunatus kandeliicorticis]